MIRPIEMQMLLPRTESVGNLQQHEIQQNVNANANAANEVIKQEQKSSETVVRKEEKEFDSYKYDAKDEGKSQYFGSRGNQKRKKKEDTASKQNNVSEHEQEEKDYQPRINIQI